MVVKYEKLFSPITLRGCTFPNRMLATALVSRLAAEDGHITDAFRARYQRVARGGVGAMVIEAAVVLPSRSSFNLRISDDQFVPELRDFADSLRAQNPALKVGLQLIHFLKLSRSGWRQKVEDFKTEDLRAAVEQFAGGARRAQSAGFDFVEIHMAHFTTLASFLSLVNKRKDRYGGDFEGRMRLPTEVVLAVRDAVGEDFPIGVRVNGEEFTIEGNTLLQSRRIARRLAKLGVDYISVSAGERIEDAAPPPPGMPPFAGTGFSGYRMSPRWWNPDGANVYLAEGIRSAVRDAGFDTPILTAGKIRTPELAEEILEQGKADIIGLARALLADPDFPVKAKEGRADTIVKCAACGCCSEADERYETITCARWPEGALNAPEPWLVVPPCKADCPARIDIRGYIELITQGEYKKALDLVRSRIPLPYVISRVCPHPCESDCNRGKLDDPIAVNALKRFIVDYELKNRRGEIVPPPRTRREQVAIIGSGPAGLTAAHDLAIMGYGTTIFEASSVPGGMMMAIPDYRLPKDLVQTEIGYIRDLGVEIKLDSPIGESGLSLDDLWQQGYKAIFVAVGAHESMKLDVPGEDLKGVGYGIDFLKDVNKGKDVRVGERVAVVGGGNVAADAARTSLRLGAKEVFVIYRRSVEEMPAYREEAEAAEAEGIKIHYLAAPVRIAGKNGKVARVECVRTELGEPDASGRRRPIPVEGSKFIVDADMVIVAIGEVPALSFLPDSKFSIATNGTLMVDPGNLTTGVAGIFAGGDAVTGPATIIEAITAGKKGATFIDKYLRGESLDYQELLPARIKVENERTEGIRKRGRQKMPTLSPKRRTHNFGEVELGLTEMAALDETDRCLQCGMHPKCHT